MWELFFLGIMLQIAEKPSMYTLRIVNKWKLESDGRELSGQKYVFTATMK